MTDIRTSAEHLAQQIESLGLRVNVSHSVTTFGQSSYVYASIVGPRSNGTRRAASFGIRVSDHGVGANRHYRDGEEIQHYIHGPVTSDARIKLLAVAQNAVESVRL